MKRILSAGECKNRSDFATLFAEAQDVIRQDPYRVGLPPIELGKRFVEMPLPFSREFWICTDLRGDLLGRISANTSATLPGLGYIGFFEARSFDITQRLVESATEWLKEKGVGKIYGPINFNTWLPYRFRLPDDSALNSVAMENLAFEPVNPPEYPHWFHELGFKVIERYHSDGLDGIDGMLEGTRKAYEKASSLGYSFRTFDASTFMERDAPPLHQISMVAFEKNFLFERVPFDFFAQLYIPSASKADLSLGYFVCNPEGKEVGYFFNFEYKGYLVLKTAGLAPEARGLGLSNAMLHLSAQEAHRRGIRKSMTALVRTGIQSESYAKKEKAIWRHEYGLFGKEL